MFLTVNPNAAIDRILFIDRFIPGGVMRPEKVIDSVGGKGFDISVALRGLGQDVLALGFRAGSEGKRLEKMLDAYGIRHELITVEGETRIAHVIVDQAEQQHSHINTMGYAVGRNEIKTLLTILDENLIGCGYAASAGSLPKGAPLDLFASIVKIARQHNVPVLIDSSGEPQVQAARACPTILKMNQEELGETFNILANELDDLAAKCRRFREENKLENLVITCGKQGILAVTPKKTYRTECPILAVVNAAGAGDAVSAALMWRLSAGDDWTDALRWAAAAGAAVVLTERTAELRIGDVERLLPDVKVHEIAE